MRNPALSASLISTVLLLAQVINGPASAHHSGAMFDFTRCKLLTGTVRKLEWKYPHNWLWVNVVDAQGVTTPWGFEFMSPTQAKGIDPLWSKDVMQKGDKVTVKFLPLKDGRSGGAMKSVTLPNGYVLGGSPGECAVTP
jgi:hypothetical protein